MVAVSGDGRYAYHFNSCMDRLFGGAAWRRSGATYHISQYRGPSRVFAGGGRFFDFPALDTANHGDGHGRRDPSSDGDWRVGDQICYDTQGYDTSASHAGEWDCAKQNFSLSGIPRPALSYQLTPLFGGLLCCAQRSIGWSNLELALTNGWQAYGGTYGSTIQIVVKDGVCHIEGLVEGLVKDGSQGSVIATLPTNCRPNKRLVFNVNHHEHTARVDVAVDGTIVWYAGNVRDDWISLTGITFASGSSNQSPLSLANGWRAYQGSFGSPTIVVKDGVCYVEGLVTGGSQGSVIATLPTNCRPNKQLIFNVNHHEHTARVDVRTDGSVSWKAGNVSGDWISLTGMIFTTQAITSGKFLAGLLEASLLPSTHHHCCGTVT